jgi:polysaccharide biosynthesis protein PelA
VRSPITSLASLAIALILAAGTGSAGAAPSDPRLASVKSFAFAIGTGDLDGDVASRYAPFDLVVVDGEEATASKVAAIERGGAIVLAYLDVGTIERGRFWYPRAKPYRMELWGDWGEWYARVSARGYRDLIASTVAPALLRKGFDGLFLDNTDMIESHPRQVDGMRRLVKRLSRRAHNGGGLLFSQNGEDSIGPTLAYYDGWNREDVTWTYDFDRRRYVHQSAADVRWAKRAIRGIAAEGLLVTATDYVAAGDPRAADEAVANACAAGAVPFVSNIWLTRIPAKAYTCSP